jgi:hypothetical protein
MALNYRGYKVELETSIFIILKLISMIDGPQLRRNWTLRQENDVRLLYRCKHTKSISLVTSFHNQTVVPDWIHGGIKKDEIHKNNFGKNLKSGTNRFSSAL